MAQAASTYLGEQRRRSTRLEQTAPVIIRGVDLLGQPFEERTTAQNLSFHGCRYASKHHLPKNTWITLELPSGDSRADAMCVRARVAWIQRPRTLRDLFQVGVELEKGKNVWGVTLPPRDWISGGQASETTTISIAAETVARNDQNRAPIEVEAEASLEVYLQMALAHANRDFTPADEEPQAMLQESYVLLEQLRQEFTEESNRVVDEARAAADEVARQRTSELHDDFQKAQKEAADAFHKTWMEELERGRVSAKEEIAAVLTHDVAAQLAGFEEQVRGTITSEWTEKLSRMQVERSLWQSEMQALREEVYANAEASDKRIDDRFKETLTGIRRELESSRGADGTDAENIPMRSRLLAEFDTARTQWNELLASSLDSAGQRLSERLSSSSQELAHRTGQELAKRAAELQRESGLTVETSRAALGELRSALESEVEKAKTSLAEIEQTAARFSEYSRQLDAASQDSLNELRQKLESSVTQQCAELDKHAAGLEGKFSKRAEKLLEQLSQQTVARTAAEVDSAVAAGLERTAKAAEELAAREEQAEGILRIHRERLRQSSEQMQREGATHLASSVAAFQKDLEGLGIQALAQGKTEMEANGGRAVERAAEALAKETARQLVEADAQLLVQAQQAIDSAQDRMQKGVHTITGKFRSELGEIEASQLRSAQEKLALAEQQQIDSAKNELTKAAEKAASTFGEVIEEAAETALRNFITASEARVEEGRTRLATTAENVLLDVQGHAQNSFEHFQEQLAIKTEQALKHTSESLAHQFDAALERFRLQGEAKLADWSEKQTMLSEQALDKHDVQLQTASNSWVQLALEQFNSQVHEQVDSTVRATEGAVREACAGVFDTLAQIMKKQMQGALEMRHATPIPETNPQEQRASA